eukprot:1392178-Amorphochlora_amoeboformis.AAC.5
MQYTVCLEITVEAFAKYLSTAPVEYKSKLQLIMGMNMEKSLVQIQKLGGGLWRGEREPR